MKTKICFLLMLCFLLPGMSTTYSYAVENSDIMEEPPLLVGEVWYDSKSRTQSVFLGYTDDSLIFVFRNPVGTININISGAEGTVFEEVWDVTDRPKEFTVDISDYAPGVYYIELTDGLGGRMHGQFTLK